MKIAIVQPGYGPTSESFIRAHVERLPGKIAVIYGLPPQLAGRDDWWSSLWGRIARKWRRTLTRTTEAEEFTRAYLTSLRIVQPDVVLAEYGPMGVAVMDACAALDIPLVVHFHGYDAYTKTVLAENSETYRRLFDQAVAVIAPSQAMTRKLIALGAAPDKVHCNPYGVDCRRFYGGRPANVPPVFLAVGRFVEKKAPLTTIQAFAEVHRNCPEARLRMIGDGPLLALCRDLARQLKIENAVAFLGALFNEPVQEEMRGARAFVQHSVEAATGDCEGTPVAVLEAGATGLPVVATRHAGIPEVVVEGETGFLVDEGDVAGMARRMLRLAEDARLAQTLGEAGRRRVVELFSIERSIDALSSILSCGARPECPREAVGAATFSDSPAA